MTSGVATGFDGSALPATRRGAEGSRLGNHAFLSVFALAFGVALALAFLALRLLAPTPARPPCSLGGSCPPPPGPARLLFGKK